MSQTGNYKTEGAIINSIVKSIEQYVVNYPVNSA